MKTYFAKRWKQLSQTGRPAVCDKFIRFLLSLTAKSSVRQTAVLEISNFCLHCLQYSVSLVYLEWKCDYLIKSVMPVNQEQLCYKNKSFFCRRVDGRRKQGTLLLWAISLGDPSMSESYFLIFFGNVATILLK